MPVWLAPALKALSHVATIAKATAPIFTKRNAPSQGPSDLVQQQIGELQSAASQTDARVRELAAQLKEALSAIEQGAKTDVEERRDVEQRLRDGERVWIAFIGGNEVQAQYDEAVMEQLVREWPGLSVQFEHTGWSSNWGRDLTRLIELANGSDAVVLMPMMRTTLGRRIREALKRPWLSCPSTGKAGMLASVRQAARLAVRLRLGTSDARCAMT